MQADIASGWNLTAPCDMEAVRRLAEKYSIQRTKKNSPATQG